MIERKNRKKNIIHKKKNLKKKKKIIIKKLMNGRVDLKKGNKMQLKDI